MLFALHFSPVYLTALIHNLLFIYLYIYTDALTNITHQIPGKPCKEDWILGLGFR